MIEQSKRNGPLFYSKESTKTVATKRIEIPEVKFGPPKPVIIHRNPQTDKLLVEDVNKAEGHVYGGGYEKTIPAITYQNDILYPYYCGIAIYEEEEHVYWIQNQPEVTIPNEVDLTNIKLPPTLVGYPYEETFTYSPQLMGLLENVKSTYVDKYKRPLNPEAFRNKIHVPIGIDKVKTKFKEIANTAPNYPIVCDLKDTTFGILDLEPGYTEEEKQKAESYPYIYKEETPRGGVHYLIYTDSDAFKYRISDRLEVIVNSMVTFYGNGEFSTQEPTILTRSDFEDCTEVGHKQLEIVEVSQDIKELVDLLMTTNYQEDAKGVELVQEQMATDKDESHAEYVSMLHLLNKNIGPYLGKLKTVYSLPETDIPWIMAEYLSRILEFRLKHNREIKGVPYLVYVATAAYNYWKTTDHEKVYG